MMRRRRPGVWGWLPRLLVRWTRRGRQRPDDLQDELRAHIAHREDDLIRQGLTPAEARRRAMVEFGGVDRYADAIRQENGWRWRGLPESLWRDVVIGVRRLVAAPAFAFFAVLSLALGLGATTAVYSVIHSVLWAPVPFDAPDDIVIVATPSSQGTPIWRQTISEHDFDTLDGHVATLVPFAASVNVYETVVTDRAAEFEAGEAVFGDYFGVFRVPMVAGRPLQPSDAVPGAPLVVVLNERMAPMFGDGVDVVGSTVRLGAQTHTVVGVAPVAMTGPTGEAVSPRPTAFWIPESQRPPSARGRVADPSARELAAFGRLASGRTLSDARSELTTASARLDAVDPHRLPETRQGAGTPWPRAWQARQILEVHTSRRGQASGVGFAIVMLVSLVLLVACTNLANLTLARGLARRSELAIRRALGASRARVVREQVVESGLVALVGGIAAVGVARVLLVFLAMDVPQTNGRSFHLAPGLNLSVLGLSAVAMLGALGVFGIGPAWHLTGRAQAGRPQDAAVVGGRRDRGPWRLIGLQVGVAVTFFLVASVSLRAVADAARHDSGIALEELGMVTVFFDRDLGYDLATMTRATEAVVAAAGRQPGLQAVAATTGMPFGQTLTPLVQVTTPDQPFGGALRSDSGLGLLSTPGLIETLGVSMRHGRSLQPRDATGDRGAVVSALLAREVFGQTDVVGRELLVRVWAREPTLPVTIVGVAEDTDVQWLRYRTTGVIYLPIGAAESPYVVFVGRTTGDPLAASAALRAAVRQAAPNLGVYNAGAASDLLASGYAMLRLAAVMATSLGALALLLSMVGLYGVLSQFVSQRTREMGLRLALGASTQQVARLALGQGVRPVLAGLIAGFVLSAIVRGGIRALMTPVEIVDWFALAIIPLPVLLAAAVACYLPARRAARVDPNVALRDL